MRARCLLLLALLVSVPAAAQAPAVPDPVAPRQAAPTPEVPVPDQAVRSRVAAACGGYWPLFHRPGELPALNDEEFGECIFVVATVVAVQDTGATQLEPPVVLLRVEEVLTGDISVGMVAALWGPRPLYMPCSVGEELRIQRWREQPIAGPAVGARFLMGGQLDRSRRWLITRSDLRVPDTDEARAALRASLARMQRARTSRRRAELAARRAEARAAVRDDELYAAVRAGDVVRVEVLLGEGVRPTARFETGRGALHLAAEAGSTRIVQLLLDAGAPPDYLDGKGDQLTALGLAALGGHLETVELLLARGANPGARSWKRTPILLGPAGRGHCAVVETLLAHGARARVADADGLTPLHVSAHAGHVACVSALLAARADPNRVTSYGFWPVHAALRHPEVLRLLLRAGASPGVRDVEGRTPLQSAKRYGIEGGARVLQEAGVQR